MAGIGFVLRKLTDKNDLSGVIRAFFHSAVVAVGPWIMIVICMSAITSLSYPRLELETLREFQSVFIYNSFFSFIIAAPFYMVSARYVADCLYAKTPSPVPGILIYSLLFTLCPALIFATLFYSFYADLTRFSIILSIVNFSLLSQIWIAMLYLGSIRNFRAITLCWLLGMAAAIFSAYSLGQNYGFQGLLGGMNIGLALLLFSQQSAIFAEYPYRYQTPYAFPFYFRKYKQLFWSGFFLFAGMWVDKIIMWGAPEAITYSNNLSTYPTYDGAMFFSYLTIIPGLALFTFSLETNFFESYILYINHIERNAPLAFIEEEKENIQKKIFSNSRAFFILQGCISFSIIALAPSLFSWIGRDFLELSIFRLGTLGAFFLALIFFIVILFSYFDSQNNALKISLCLFLSNTIFTLALKKLGFLYYGLGYCLASILTFFFAAILLVRFLSKLNYHIFITNTVKRLHMASPKEDVRITSRDSTPSA